MTTDIDREAFVAAFEDALGPLLKLGLHYGVSAAELSAALLRAGLATMTRHISLTEQRPPSDRRLAKYLGVSEKAFRAIAEDAEARRLAERRLSAEILSAILGVWHSDPMYASVYELPRDLELGNSGRANTFAGLVEKVAPGTDANLALNALLSAGCVEYLDGAYVRASARAYFLPSKDHESRLRRMGATLRQYNEVFYRNLTSENRLAEGLLERTLVSDSRISDAGVVQFHLAAAAAVQKLMSDLDATLGAIGRDSEAGEGKVCGLGVYLFDDADRPVPAGLSGYPIDIDKELAATNPST
jgi:hypothetical protein